MGICTPNPRQGLLRLKNKRSNMTTSGSTPVYFHIVVPFFKNRVPHDTAQATGTLFIWIWFWLPLCLIFPEMCERRIITPLLVPENGILATFATSRTNVSLISNGSLISHAHRWQNSYAVKRTESSVKESIKNVSKFCILWFSIQG